MRRAVSEGPFLTIMDDRLLEALSGPRSASRSASLRCSSGWSGANVSIPKAMALIGHETESMFIRYAINDLSMLEGAVAKVAALDD